MGVVYSILRKDLLVEYRSRQAFLTTLFFGLLVIVVGNFTLAAAGDQFALFAPGVLWISFLFSGLLFLNHIVYVEKEESTISGLLMSPASAGQVYLGKLLTAIIFLVSLQTILLPVFHVFFNFPFGLHTLWLWCLIVLTAIGYCALGVLFSTMALGLKNREIILSAILFPIMLPVMLMASKSSIVLLNDLPMRSFYNWLTLLVTFDVVFVIASYWAYFFILEEL